MFQTYRDFIRAHLQEVLGLTQILAYHVRVKGHIRQMVQPLGKNKEPSQLHGIYGPWLVLFMATDANFVTSHNFKKVKNIHAII